jgi:hypothetical protein
MINYFVVYGRGLLLLEGLFIMKPETQTRHKLSWGEAIWGRTNGPTNQPTVGLTDRRTKRVIEALCSGLKMKFFIVEISLLKGSLFQGIASMH